MARKNLLQGIKRPKGLDFEHLEDHQDSGRFIAYPFEPGYGQTIGNSLRRVLLSSIQGYAVVAVRITNLEDDGSSHVITSEFEMIPHVIEDTPVFIQNLKQLQLKLPDDIETLTVAVVKQGEGSFMASDLAIEGIEVMNPDHLLCTLAEGAHLEFEIQVNLGRGYVPAEENAQDINVIGALAVDSIFSPVQKVAITVEDYRVGHRADYDKLILDIKTNGIIRPSDALAEAAKIMKDHLSIFINFDESSVAEVEEIDEDEFLLREYLETPVEQLELSVRSSNCLKNAEIRTLKDLVSRSEDEIAKTRNFGKKSLLEIKDKLREWDLSFGMVDFKNVKQRLRQGKTQDSEGK
ncbi:DNA-directed RNA polymerase subunit alpha [Entomospira culicis]|uniref:DNA-directed RNA polymerase subunit alpha n=1 Tax=Entomospira culicis TaxID=2719989 RepID=A0A968GG58_9SPIO|nr:DNA-directed RNA polymerase subunit alpha [Entomospira culicis]NIZ19695.1 DNA-directed RNA polymerase subunit alpha [Entomospira culicis]NIZ69909.1 DNA-directed RNA polymerase subunit alpha [Entomospira culicis]WDI37014.1 DNA-directed RNA polymerase subunit alpha [Entomospira culicis]WDI38643.1 DNA-directed RNA polymerase subunit alpha [Entomospira culicis]